MQKLDVMMTEATGQDLPSKTRASLIEPSASAVHGIHAWHELIYIDISHLDLPPEMTSHFTFKVD